MQASELWSGTEYAHTENRPKGVETPMNCKKVRVLRVFKEKQDQWNERMTTFASVEIFDKDDNVVATRTVRARDIVDFWDEYQDRYQHIMAQRKKAEEERLARRAAEEAEKQRIMRFFTEKFGVNADDVSIYGTTVSVSFKKEDIPT